MLAPEIFGPLRLDPDSVIKLSHPNIKDSAHG
jgi:hypothetical protein